MLTCPTMQNELSPQQRSLLFWGSFLALMTAGIGFGIRVMNVGTWIGEFNISEAEAGGIFGASLWPIAVGMILFSLIVDKVGYKPSMLLAAACHIGSTIWTFTALDKGSLIAAFVLAGFAHGIVEACINPLCATMYKESKTKMLNILHASWPAGIVVGAALGLLFGGDGGAFTWRQLFLFLLLPSLIYAVMFAIVKVYPKDERVENKVSYLEMMREFGGLGVFVAATFLFYELTNQLGLFAEGAALAGKNQLLVSLAFGAALGLVCGISLKSKGKVMFFILCLIMIPLATAEIATDGWIQKLMKPVLANEYEIDSGWAIVLSSLIMMTLRFFAGVPLKYLNPPSVLLVSSIFSIVGLFLLSSASGGMIFLAFVLYGVGQTFYWPTVLGFTAEQFPKGGAMTLNTVSAMGLLTVGIFGMPFLGAVGDHYNAEVVKVEQAQLFDKVDASSADGSLAYTEKNKKFFGWEYDSVNVANLLKDDALVTEKGAALVDQMELPDEPTKEQRLEALEANKTFNTTERSEVLKPEGVALEKSLQNNGRKVLKVAASLPAIMAVAFLLLILYYKARGGYKPVQLDRDLEKSSEGPVL